jgi:hypothetical protein
MAYHSKANGISHVMTVVTLIFMIQRCTKQAMHLGNQLNSISGFHSKAEDNYALLGCYTASSGNLL